MDEDQTLGGRPVTVISDRYWERCFGRARHVVGRTIIVNDTVFTVVGVAAPGFTGVWIGRPIDIWVPVMMQPQVNRDGPWIRYSAMVVARLQAGVARAQARAAADVAYQRAAAEQASPNAMPQSIQRIARGHLMLEPVGNGYSTQREGFGPPLLMVVSVAALVLLIACTG
jgi:hypothetical protein